MTNYKGLLRRYAPRNDRGVCGWLGWVEGIAYHVVVSLDKTSKIGYIITAYQPSLDKFEPDFKTRR